MSSLNMILDIANNLLIIDIIFMSHADIQLMVAQVNSRLNKINQTAGKMKTSLHDKKYILMRNFLSKAHSTFYV